MTSRYDISKLEHGGPKLNDHGGQYVLQVVRVSQSEELQRGDGHPFPRTKKY